MKKFLTILLLSSALLAIVEENQAAPNVIESQKTGLTITTDRGQAFKINTDGPVPVVTNAAQRFSRKNVGFANHRLGHISTRRMEDHQEDGNEENTPEEEAQEEELLEAVKLLGKVKRVRKNDPGDTVTMSGELVDEIIEKLESYEDTLQEIIAESEADSESSSSSSSSTNSNGGHEHHSHSHNHNNDSNDNNDNYNDHGDSNNDRRRRRMKLSSRLSHNHFVRSRANRVVHNSRWVIKP